MHTALTRPWPSRTIGLAVAAMVGLLGVYCLLYNVALGRPETVWNAFSWPVINLVPFMLAFEAGKRVERWPAHFAVLTCAFAVSIGLDFVKGSSSPLLFEATRRVPAAVLVLAAWWSTRWFGPAKPPENTALPLLPGQIDWVEAAGNYVLIHGAGRPLCHRATLSAVEAALAGHGFVRVHRSNLVRASAVARATSKDVILRSGTRVAIGTRYRHALPR